MTLNLFATFIVELSEYPADARAEDLIATEPLTLSNRRRRPYRGQAEGKQNSQIRLPRTDGPGASLTEQMTQQEQRDERIENLRISIFAALPPPQIDTDVLLCCNPFST
ncbi:hypothetical protein [Caballeronia sp. KNU42]